MSGTDQPANDGKTVNLAITDGINETAYLVIFNI